MKLFARLFFTACMLIRLVTEFIHNGEPRKPENYNFAEWLLVVLLQALLLYVGGFYG